jgi:peptidoglycan hydrolase-like protein with peptidoglycan-binding domain
MRRLSILVATIVAAAIAAGPAPAMAKHQVAGLQVALYRYGLYKGAIDGIAGPLTKRAIVDLQRSAKLEPDGVADKETRAVLGRFGRPLFGTRTLQRGMIGFDVSVLQFLLASRGFPPQRLNSNFGPLTEELVRKFQRKAGLVPDGVVGRATRAALLGAKKKRKPNRLTQHVVRPGESLTAIAERYGTNVRTLAGRNRLDPQRVLLIGTRLVVPKGGASAASRPSVKASIDRWAAHYGVSPRLARALAWQESGFQQSVRSSVDAAGVMQVTPATWSFVELFVIGRNVPQTMNGNVRVGIAYLGHLLEEFKGDIRLAVAAYYQGPAGVRRHGLYAETERFVANVLALRGRV